MNIEKKKKEVKERFETAVRQREQLDKTIEQLRGQYALLEEMEKEDKKGRSKK